MGEDFIHEDEFVGDNFCFLAGQTPKYLNISFSGIVKGWTWHEGDGECKNGTFSLLWQEIGYWASIIAKSGVQFWTGETGTWVFIDADSPVQQFRYDKSTPCNWAGASEMQGPNSKFYGGWYQVSYRLPLPGPSITQTAIQLGLTREASLKYEFGRVSDSVLWQRFARKQDGTRIYIHKNNY